MIPTAVGIKGWLVRTPSVDEVRPEHCAGCGRASRPVGGPLVVHGQGFVQRQVRGLVELEDVPRVVEIAARKFECQACGSVMTVVPADLLPGRQYSASSIALALYLWLVAGLSDVAVRAKVCAWRVRGGSGARGWAQLYRWVRAAPWLFRTSRPLSREVDADEAARRVVVMLLARGSLRATIDAGRVFAGAALAA